MKKNIVDNKHVLVLGTGPSLKIYKDKIIKYINDNNCVTFGCNNITDILIPDYHFYGSTKRWKKYGHLVNKKSILVTVDKFSKKIIKKKWKGKLIQFKTVERIWKYGSDQEGSKEQERCCVRYKNNKMFGCFRDVGTLAAFLAFVQGAKKVDIVGFDGYTLYSKQDLQRKKGSQHCYGEGLTDGTSYKYCKKKDWDKYKTLRLLYKYVKNKWGFGFTLLTPTVYDEFYDSNIFKIKIDPMWQKWKEPDPTEYKNFYFDYTKNKKIKNPIY
jgi:hypothetical protein